MYHFWGLSRLPLFKKNNRGMFLPDGQYNKPISVEWLSGACITLKREVIETAGVLPEDYFMYAEDMQWCENILNCGWELHFLPESTIWHLMGGEFEGEK